MVIPHIYLASSSPRRAELLRQIGVQFQVMPSDIDESVLPGEAAQDYVVRLAASKALVCQGKCADPLHGLTELPILAADTTVCVDDRILGKPENDAEAFAMLSCLSGRWHMVHTGLAVASSAGLESMLSSTRVEFAVLSADHITAYIASGEPLGKAGAYGIQGLAGAFIRRIEGSYSGVMGLPIFETVQLLRNAGIKLG